MILIRLSAKPDKSFLGKGSQAKILPYPRPSLAKLRFSDRRRSPGLAADAAVCSTSPAPVGWSKRDSGRHRGLAASPYCHLHQTP
jgi:hypothetical protein